jgi:hypothetical protein
MWCTGTSTSKGMSRPTPPPVGYPFAWADRRGRVNDRKPPVLSLPPARPFPPLVEAVLRWALVAIAAVILLSVGLLASVHVADRYQIGWVEGIEYLTSGKLASLIATAFLLAVTFYALRRCGLSAGRRRGPDGVDPRHQAGLSRRDYHSAAPPLRVRRAVPGHRAHGASCPGTGNG